MGRLFFTSHDADLNLPKSSVFEPSVEIAFGETEELIAVQFPCLLESMLHKVED